MTAAVAAASAAGVVAAHDDLRAIVLVGRQISCKRYLRMQERHAA